MRDEHRPALYGFLFVFFKKALEFDHFNFIAIKRSATFLTYLIAIGKGIGHGEVQQIEFVITFDVSKSFALILAD